MFFANARVDTYRGTRENAYGDTEDDNTTPHLVDKSASVAEYNKSVQDAASGTWRTVRRCRVQLIPGTDVALGDRLRDRRTGRRYAIDEITPDVRGLGGSRSLVLECRIV